MKGKSPTYWIEAAVLCPPETVEAVSNFFFEQGASGVEEREGLLCGYFPEPDHPASLESRLSSYLAGLRALGFSVGAPKCRIVPQADWAESWRKHFQPIRVTPKILVKPPWETVQTDAPIVVDIMPRMAFGTGQHETTRLCLRLLEESLVPNSAVLDLGSGSGILAIAAVRLGAGRVVAVEIDPVAVANLEENARLNGVEQRIDIRLGGFEAVGKDRFDLILANLQKNLIEEWLRLSRGSLLPGGRLILSGLLTSDEEAIRTALDGAGLAVVRRVKGGEWIALLVAAKSD